MVFFRKAELLCITSLCPVTILNGINGECSICNAVLLLLSVAYVASVLQFHIHFLAQILDYLQLLIIVQLKAVVMCFAVQVQIEFQNLSLCFY